MANQQRRVEGQSVHIFGTGTVDLLLPKRVSVRFYARRGMLTSPPRHSSAHWASASPGAYETDQHASQHGNLNACAVHTHNDPRDSHQGQKLAALFVVLGRDANLTAIEPVDVFDRS